MTRRDLAVLGVVALGAVSMSSAAFAQTVPPTSGPAQNGSPGWYLLGPGGVRVTSWTPPVNDTYTPATGGGGRATTMPEGVENGRPIPTAPRCARSIVCPNPRGSNRNNARVTWEQTMGYTYDYSYVLPDTVTGVSAVALDSKGNLWAFQRAPIGSPQLHKFDPNGKLILQVGSDVYGGHQVKSHGMAVDAEDNVWILDTTSSTATKISPDGKLLQVIGQRGKRGDWDEAKGQRLLWEPVMIAFAANGDIYISQGHADESPNDVGSDDPTNNSGGARILQLDRTGKFIRQWYGNFMGQGRFDNGHGLGIDPTNGDIWIGDREQYRIVIYSSNGLFLRTIQMRNLVCSIQFDPEGNPWMGTAQEGQFLKLDRTGKVLGAVGRGNGRGPGQFGEASYLVFKGKDIFTGDTTTGRITRIVAPST
jgi:hypothetical protein